MVWEFDDARLEDAETLASHDAQLRHLASACARIRIEAAAADLDIDTDVTPRGVVVVGPEARLIRAVVEPVCPVPLVAWSLPGLPGWAGPLDLVVALASNEPAHDSEILTAAIAEADRRGCQLLIAAPTASPVSDAAGSRGAIALGTRTGDPTAAAIVVLSLLHRLRLGPAVNAEHAAEVADMVAEECSPHRDLSSNPGKDLALGMADGEPLIWGSGVLAARAGRRIAEAIRFYTGRQALAADASELAHVLRQVSPADPFADPFTDGGQTRPVVLMLDDAQGDGSSAQDQRLLRDLAGVAGVRVCDIEAASGSEVDRYLNLLQNGLYGVNYLAIGLGIKGARE